MMKLPLFKKTEKVLAITALFSLFTPLLNAQNASRLSQKKEVLPVQESSAEKTEDSFDQIKGDSKIAPDLLEIVKHPQNARISPEGVGEKIKVIIKYKENKAGAENPDSPRNTDYARKLRNFAGKLLQDNKNVGLLSAEMSLTQVENLSKDESIEYISPDRETQAAGHLEHTTGANLVRSLMGTSTSIDGRGIGIAVIDSGMHTNHDIILRWADPNNNITGYTSPVIYQKDFIGTFQEGVPGTFSNWQQNYNDQFGHGTHVATMISGNSMGNNYYSGIARGANLLNLRVLNSYGKGNVSNVIAAIDWAIANKAAYNIRVLNISLGTPAKDSYTNDPLCLAARRAVNAGIVVVASAGNFGKTTSGQKLYGGINSPGIEPSVITVGAVNTYGTDARSDDTVATFSSRGPTRGYKTVNGVKRYDNLIKPDLVAPGNKIIGGVSYYDCTEVGCANSIILDDNPHLYADTLMRADGNGNYEPGESMMYLSGTSMATPVVAGAVALMLQANPHLTPSLVKAILMYSAQPIRNANMLEQGAGQLNIEGAVRLARLVRTDFASLSQGTSMLTGTLTTQSSTIAGQSVVWGQGVITNYCFLYGSGLMQNRQGMYSADKVLSDSTFVSGGVIIKNTSLVQSTITNSPGVFTNTGNLLSNGTLFANGVTMGDGITIGNGITMGDGIVMGDGMVMGDSLPTANQVFNGDDTAAMLPAP